MCTLQKEATLPTDSELVEIESSVSLTLCKHIFLHHTSDDNVDGKLDLPVGPGGRDGDVVPRVLLRKELKGARASRLVRVLKAVSVPLKKQQVTWSRTP